MTARAGPGFQASFEEARGGALGVDVEGRIGFRKNAEDKFLGLLEAAPDAIVGVDARGRIALVNAQAERLFGYPRDELLGNPVEILIPERARAAHLEHERNYLADPKPRPMGAGIEMSGRRKDGSEFPAEISLSAFDTDDGIIVWTVIRDITDRLEEQPEHQSQRLESLGQLAGGIAHDFNNLLAVILNYASFIDEEVATAVSAPDGERWLGVKRDVEQVIRAAERAAQLTHQLLAFARRDVVRPQILNLNDVVTDVEQLLRRSIGEHLELVTSLAEDLLPIFADRGQVEQVLVNLAVNARDAMDQGGTLTIDTQNVEADADSKLAASRRGVGASSYVELRVTDTGTGIDKETLERAFEPFFTTKPKGEGSGLGLATVYGIVAQAGGDVRIYSEPGMGTTVRVLFPVTDAGPATGPQPAQPVRTHGGETVLVVEDEDAMREVTRRILARKGHEVLVARSGPNAIEIVSGHPGQIHLLVTDVVMPKMLGKEVAERIKVLRPGIRVLFMSGYAQPVLASERTLDAGVVLIEKPFTEQGLLAKVREVLDAPSV